MPLMLRIFKFLVKSFILLLLLLVIGLFSWNALSPWTVPEDQRSEIAAAIAGARSIQLYEFVPVTFWSAESTKRFPEGIKLLNQKTIENPDLSGLASVFKDLTFFKGDIPLFRFACFIPHHAIEIRGTSNLFIYVCFACDKLQIGNHNFTGIPSGWRSRLRNYFKLNGIDVKDGEEYEPIRASG